MRSYIERAQDFIQQVFPYINGINRPWEVRTMIASFNDIYSRKVIVRNGLSRIALITSDYVVKFDYDEEEVDSIGGCENEYEIYYYAQREGVEDLFARITPYYYNDRTFFIMPRIYGIGSGTGNAMKYMTAEEKDFCNEYKITDLHCNNYGFRHGKVCLVDYACHLSETDYDSEYDTESEVSES